MSDPNRKTQRSFYCRDNLWDLFEVMARDLGCSMDYLLNEAMRHYAHSRNYGLDNAPHHAPPPPQPAAAAPPPQPVAPPPPAANPQSGFIRAAAPPVLGNSNDAYNRGFEHRTFERLPAAAPPPAPHVPAMTAQMGAIPPPPPQAPPLSGTYNAAGAPSSGQFMAAHLTGQFPPAPPPSRPPPPPQPAAAAAPPPPPKTVTSPMPPGFIDLDDDRDEPPLPSSAFEIRHSLAAAPSVPSSAASNKPQQLSLIFNGQRYPITKDKFIIGRASQITDLTIRDGNVSRQHCAVIQRSGQFFIKDLESTNGIEYQGVRIDSKKIDEGDVFNICEYSMRFTFR